MDNKPKGPPLNKAQCIKLTKEIETSYLCLPWNNSPLQKNPITEPGIGHGTSQSVGNVVATRSSGTKRSLINKFLSALLRLVVNYNKQ